MAKEKKQTYDELRHTLDSDMLKASTLPTRPERQGFVNRAFLDIHRAYKRKDINHAEYLKLVNRLAEFKQGEYNDYIDTLTGAAHVGLLELAIQGELSVMTPEASRQRRDVITDLTGVHPIKPETEKEKD